MKKNMRKIVVAIWIVSSIILACNFLTSAEIPIVANEATPTEQNLETLPPPLANVEFPEDVKPYPSDWPIDLRLPESFKTVDFSQGTLPGGTKPGKSVKIRFTGTMQDAADELRAFLSEKGWKIVDETDLDSEGKVWIIERDGGSTGMIVIDSQGSGNIVIIATFYV